MSKFFIGIDPGTPITIAVLGDGFVEFYDEEEVGTQSKKGRTMRWENNPHLISEVLSYYQEGAIAVVETATPMPKQGIVSTSRYVGSNYMVRGILAALRIPYEEFRPAAWKKELKLGRDKEQSRAMAINLYPQCIPDLKRKKDHNRAEALLMAHMLKEKHQS